VPRTEEDLPVPRTEEDRPVPRTEEDLPVEEPVPDSKEQCPEGSSSRRKQATILAPANPHSSGDAY